MAIIEQIFHSIMERFYKPVPQPISNKQLSYEEVITRYEELSA